MKFRAIVRKLATGRPKRRMPGFDEVYYQYWYRDVGQFKGPALQHYLIFGWKEGRDPSAGFSTDGYLAANPDVKALGINPLVHFLSDGLAEGRKGWEKDYGVPAPSPRLVQGSEAQKLLAPPRAH